jgi:hypothetical protein
MFLVWQGAKLDISLIINSLQGLLARVGARGGVRNQSI